MVVGNLAIQQHQATKKLYNSNIQASRDVAGSSNNANRQ